MSWKFETEMNVTFYEKKNNPHLIVLFTLSIFLFFSCQLEKKPIQSGTNAKTFQTDRLKVTKSEYPIKLDNFLSFGVESTMTIRDLDNTKYLIFCNTSYNSIDIYEFGFSEMSDRIKLNLLAEEKIIKLSGSYLFDLDSILIVNSFLPNTSFYLDGSGRYMKSIPIEDVSNQQSFINVIHLSRVGFFNHKDWLYFSSWEVSFNDSKVLDPNYNFAWRMNLTNGKVEALPIKYPQGYIKEDIDSYAALDISCSRMKDQIIYSFPQSDTIRIYDMNTGNVTSNILKGKYKSTSPYPQPNRGDYLKYANSILNQGMYFDDKKELFYLFRMMPIENDVDINQGEDYDIKLQKPLTIEILDKEFNYVDHLALPKNEYSTQKIFVDDGLLYISRNHPFSRTLSEDILTFEVFDIVIK